MKRYKLKNDRHRQARGGRARALNVICGRCRTSVVIYQKDGTGRLLRCYLDRILAPKALRSPHTARQEAATTETPQLTCPKCQALIGTLMRHASGRLAFRLWPGAFVKKYVD